MNNQFEYIVVQAGGKGTRLKHLTANKPKCLVPINNLPMIFHLFQRFPEKKFIVIGDYKYDVLNEYLKAFARVEYLLVDARGKTGTCGGIKDALHYIPNKKGFMLIWSDLVLSSDFSFLESNENYIALSGDFECRWKYENSMFEEVQSKQNGVSGLFIFKDKDQIDDVPENGEFVRYLSEKKLSFKAFTLQGTKEFGLLSEYEKLPVEKCRPFNKMTVHGDRIIKEGLTQQGKDLGKIECDWYKKADEYDYNSIPIIYSYSPLIMEKIVGKNIYECKDCSFEEKQQILTNIVCSLKKLHSCDSCDTDYFSISQTYVKKTFSRLEIVRNLIPFAENEYITINGRRCKNIFFCREWLDEWVSGYEVNRFKYIHGDCTFSNMMIRENGEVVLIDPRGYFGNTKYFGDPAYDWAKLYYSIVGNYDEFNIKHFELKIDEKAVEIKIQSSGWEDMEDLFWQLIGADYKKSDIKLLHALIWLALTTYAWENYDSICAAFYIGLYYFAEIYDGE